MAIDWRRLCKAKDLSVDDSVIDVRLAESRHHKVSIEETHDSFELTGIIAGPKIVGSMPDLPQQVWTKNRTTQLVGFRIDFRGRLVGEVLVPRIGLEAAEFQLYVRTLAVECDRMEYLLTGRDVE